jgi:phosphoglycolate phosphatase
VPALLVLFDVDKTLFVNSDPLMGQATTDAIEAVWDLRLPGDAIRRVDHRGQTAMRITREILRTEGLSNAEIDPDLARWCKEAADRYLELLAKSDTSDWRAPEGTAAALERIEHRALLTGNPEPVARARIERIGLAEFFPQGQGAFGCETEERAELIDIARGRAGNWPREQTVAVGDTPADIAGARAAGVKVIGFAADSASRDELATADAVIDRMSELPGELERLNADS